MNEKISDDLKKSLIWSDLSNYAEKISNNPEHSKIIFSILFQYKEFKITDIERLIKKKFGIERRFIRNLCSRLQHKKIIELINSGFGSSRLVMIKGEHFNYFIDELSGFIEEKKTVEDLNKTDEKKEKDN